MENEDNKLVEERREKLKELRARGQAFPNDFRRKDFAGALAAAHGGSGYDRARAGTWDGVIEKLVGE